MRQYLDLIKAIGADALPVDIVYTPCHCGNERLRYNWEPENYQELRAAVERWAHHCTFRTLYWGVHHLGKHVLHVHNRYGLSWMGPRRFVPKGIKQ